MARKVTLRSKKISKDRLSLYLEFYPPIRNPHTMKVQYKSYLGIYIYANPENELQKNINQELLTKAEAIRGQVFTSILNEEYGFLDKNKMKMDFLDYFLHICIHQNRNWDPVYKHFYTFVGGKCTFGEVTVDLTLKFRDYLIKANQLGKSRTHKKLSQNSAAGYFSKFRGLLKVAYRDKLIRENVNDFLDRIETINPKIEFLTYDELITLYNTECEKEVIKKAAIFSCLTGLRRSDILALTWEDIVPATEGGFNMRIRTDKGDKAATLPVAEETLDILGDRSEGLVFRDLKISWLQAPLKRWIKNAGITKNITFHCFRHTYATLQISFGTSLYTVSKMLTHSHVTTTEIYAEVVNDLKRETTTKIILNK